MVRWTVKDMWVFLFDDLCACFVLRNISNAEEKNDNNEDHVVFMYIKLVKIFPFDTFLCLCEDIFIFFV